MKKQKVLRKKKVEMSEPTTVTAAPTSLAPVDVPAPKLRSYLGRILRLIIETKLNPSKSHLAHTPTSPSAKPTCDKCGSPLNRDGMQWFCFTCRDVVSTPYEFGPIASPVSFSHDKIAYNHYIAYCTKIGVEAQPIEHWDSRRTKEHLDSLMGVRKHTKAKADKTEQDSLLDIALRELRRLARKQRRNYFPVMQAVPVAVRDTCGELTTINPTLVKNGEAIANPHRITRVVVCSVEMDEEFARYYSPKSRRKIRVGKGFRWEYLPEARMEFREAGASGQSQLAGATLYSITERCELQPACWTRPSERTITFDQHVARAASCTSLRDLDRNELKPSMIKAEFGQWNPFEYRQTLPLRPIRPKGERLHAKDCEVWNNSQLCTCDGKKLPPKSWWCDKCKEYVEQHHTCQPATAHLNHCLYYKTATALQKARPLMPSDAFTILFGKYAEQLWMLLHLHTMGRSVEAWIKTPIVPVSKLGAMLPLDAWLPPVKVVDHLACVDVIPCEPRKGKHYGLRQHVFSKEVGRETIRMCAGCSFSFTSTIDRLTESDEEREAILRRGVIPRPTPESVRFYNLRLGRLARSPSGQWDAITLDGGYQLCNDCGDVLTNGDCVLNRNSGDYTHNGCDPLKHPLNLPEDAYAIPKRWLKGDLSWFAQEEFKTHRVNTSGWSNTDHDCSRGDSSSRDRRASQIRRQVEPKTKGTCLFCSAELYKKEGTNFCPDTDCRKRFQDELPELNKDLLEEAQHVPLLMELYLAINKNRKATK